LVGKVRQSFQAEYVVRSRAVAEAAESEFGMVEATFSHRVGGPKSKGPRRARREQKNILAAEMPIPH
jgi:hypothetical protein